MSEDEAERAEIYAGAQALAESRIAQGYEDPDDVVREVEELLQDELAAEGDYEGWATAAVYAALQSHLEAQSTWPERTDCDRIDEALASLADEGVLARQNFTCCQTCGHSEIWEAVEASFHAGKPVRGYTFFHMQDTESAQEYGELHFAFGAALAPEEDPETLEARALGIATQVRDALVRAGLKVEWNGTSGQRVCVVGLEWRRRRPVPKDAAQGDTAQGDTAQGDASQGADS